MSYFSGCIKVSAIKARYRELVKLHHPDLGGDEEVMKAINAEYHQRLKAADGTQETRGDSKSEYRYNQATEEAIASKLAEMLARKWPGIEIELIGTWLWLSGDTKAVKDDLKALGCTWHSLKKVWYYTADKRRRFRSNQSMDNIRMKYGSRTFYGGDDRLN